MKRIATYVWRLGAIALCMMIVMIQGQSSYTVFRDINQHWAKDTINDWGRNQLISGYPDGSFKPEGQLTRAEFIAMLNNILKPSGHTTMDYKDVTQGQWFYMDMAKAVANGYISGFNDNTLRPNQFITRQEVLVILANIQGGETKNTQILLNYKDSYKVAGWSEYAVAMALEKGYISGYNDGTLRPTKSITRAETVVLLTRVFQDQISIKPPVKSDFKVIGYYPYWSSVAPSQVNLKGLTHLNYSFAIPSEDGTIRVENPNRLKEMVDVAHNAGVKVYIAIGGWGYDSVFAAIAADSYKTDNFVKSVMDTIYQYNLDGIDMDWEYPDSGDEPRNFSTMISKLHSATSEAGKGLTAAIIAGVNAEGEGTWAAKGIQDEAIAKLDWLNLMVYDGQYGGVMEHHSSYEFAANTIAYWKNTRGVSAEKLMLGVPFYGRNSSDAAITYKQIINADPSKAYSDYSQGYYYNGITTMKKKTQLAQEEVGGIMIWEITQDIQGTNSLQGAIVNSIK